MPEASSYRETGGDGKTAQVRAARRDWADIIWERVSIDSDEAVEHAPQTRSTLRERNVQVDSGERSRACAEIHHYFSRPSNEINRWDPAYRAYDVGGPFLAG